MGLLHGVEGIYGVSSTDVLRSILGFLDCEQVFELHAHPVGSDRLTPLPPSLFCPTLCVAVGRQSLGHQQPVPE